MPRWSRLPLLSLLVGASGLGGAWVFSCTPDYSGFIADGGHTATNGGPCANDSECQGLVCYNGTCVDSCSDQKKDYNETDIDCGGSKCSPCENNSGCQVNTDCKSQICKDHLCIEPSCSDQIQDQDETDVDCGGSCSPASLCGTNKKCQVAGDCESYLCNITSHKCDPPISVPQGNMICDMEETATPGALLPFGGRRGTWYGSADPTSTPTGNYTPPTEKIPGGRGSTSAYAIHAAGTAGVWSGIGFQFDFDGTCATPYDVTAYTGIQFWARADKGSSLNVTVFDRNTWEGCPPTYPKLCGLGDAGSCDDAFGTPVTVTDQWGFYQLPFKNMKQAGWGEKFPAGLDIAQTINIQFSMATGAYDIWIDDVSFF